MSKEEEEQSWHCSSLYRTWVKKYFNFNASPWGGSLLFNESVRGMQAAITYGWLPIFYALLLHDWVTYNFYINERYGNTSEALFSGTSKNQHTWSSQLGVDIVGTAFCLEFSALILTPILSGMGNWLLHRHWHKPLTGADYEQLINSITCHSWFKARIARLQMEWELWRKNTLSGPRHTNEELTSLLNDHEKHTLSRRALLNKLVDEVTPSNSNQVALLATLIMSIDTIDANQESDSVQRDQIDDIRRRALTRLANNNGLDRFKKLYATYSQWTLGEVVGKTPSFFFGLVNLFTLALFAYGYYRYARIIYEKSAIYHQFVKDHRACDDQGKIWRNMPQLGNYDCTVCGDLPFINLVEMDSTQGCLDGLLRSSENISMHLDAIKKWVQMGGIQSIDLTHQNVANWSENDFADFLNALSKITQLHCFNLSSSIPNLVWPADKKIEYLRDFSIATAISTLDLSGLHMGADNFKTFLSRNGTVFPEYIDISSNNVGDTGLLYLKEIVGDFPINTFAASYNGFTPSGIYSFSPSLIHSTLRELYLRGIHFDQISFDAFSESITQSPINRVDISHSDLTGIDLTGLGEGLAGSSIETMRMDDCKLLDEHAYALAPFIKESGLRTVSVANNDLTAQGGILLVNGSQNSTLVVLNISHNQLDDTFIDYVGSALGDLTIEYLDLSNNVFSNEALDHLIAHLPPTLSTLNLSNTRFNDANLESLVAWMAKGNTITTLILNNTRITDKGILGLSLLIKNNYPLKALSVRNVYLSHTGLTEISQWLSQNDYLTILDVSGIYADKVGAQVLAAQLAHVKAPLEALYVDGIPFEDAGVAVALGLIQPIDNQDTLKEVVISLDEKRALARARANTPLMTLSMKNCSLTAASLRAMCRVLPHTAILPTHLYLEGNPPSQAVDFNACEISSSGRLQPGLSLDFFRQAYRALKDTLYGTTTATHAPHPYDHPIPTKMPAILGTALPWSKLSQDLPANSQLAQSSYSGINFPDLSSLLLLGVCVMKLLPRVWDRLPSHQGHCLTREESQQLKNLQQQLRRVKQMLKVQLNSTLTQSGIVKDEMDYCRKAVKFIHQAIEYALDHNQISCTQLFAIQEKFDRLSQLIHRHAQQNNMLKKILLQARQIEKSHQRRGEITVSIVTRNIITGELKHEVSHQYLPGTNPALISEKPTLFQSACNLVGFWKTTAPQPQRATVFYSPQRISP